MGRHSRTLSSGGAINSATLVNSPFRSCEMLDTPNYAVWIDVERRNVVRLDVNQSAGIPSPVLLREGSMKRLMVLLLSVCVGAISVLAQTFLQPQALTGDEQSRD